MNSRLRLICAGLLFVLGIACNDAFGPNGNPAGTYNLVGCVYPGYPISGCANGPHEAWSSGSWVPASSGNAQLTISESFTDFDASGIPHTTTTLDPFNGTWTLGGGGLRIEPGANVLMRHGADTLVDTASGGFGFSFIFARAH